MTFWDEASKRILTELKEHPSDFLRQKTIRKTLHPDSNDAVKGYWGELVRDWFFIDAILPQLCEPQIGKPLEFEYFPLTSPLTVQHAYYLHTIRHKLGVFVPKLGTVLDIGGGYGGMCRLVRSLGFTGRYQIADFPEMHELQRAYLGTVQFEGIALNQISEADICIGTFSVGELPMPEREAIDYGRFKYVFLAYHPSFEGMDNVRYFESLKDKLADTFHVEIMQDRHRINNARFFIAKRK